MFERTIGTAAVRYVFGVARHVQLLLQGAVEPDPAQHGFNTEEERVASGCPQVTQEFACCCQCQKQHYDNCGNLAVIDLIDISLFDQWPGVRGEVHPQNGHLRLFGGAAFERCMHEFQQAALVLGFPSGKHM